MQGFRFDWRWVALIGFVAVLANGRSLPWPVTALTLAGGGGYLLYLAWQSSARTLSFGRRDDSRVTYWRGQRIEMPTTQRRRQSFSASTLVPMIAYALLGLALILAGLLVLLNRSGLF